MAKAKDVPAEEEREATNDFLNKLPDWEDPQLFASSIVDTPDEQRHWLYCLTLSNPDTYNVPSAREFVSWMATIKWSSKGIARAQNMEVQKAQRQVPRAEEEFSGSLKMTRAIEAAPAAPRKRGLFGRMNDAFRGKKDDGQPQ